MSMATMLSDTDNTNGKETGYPGHHNSMSSALLQAAAQASARESSGSPQDDQPDDQADDENKTKRPKRSRACQACRGMKIRCLPVEGQEACKACSKVNRPCIMPGPARKRQKTVHKVAELEQKINALQASLAVKTGQQHELNELSPPTESPQTVSTPSVTAMQRGSIASSLPPPSDKPYRSIFLPEDAPRESRPQETDSDPSKVFDYADRRMRGDLLHGQPDETYVDVIARNKVDLETANRIFVRWKREMCPYCPFVAFPETVTIEWLRSNRPMTLLTILGVACGTIRPDLQSDLMVELSRQLADRVAFLHEKSLDLAQAMLICPVWFGKHKYAKDLNFNHSIHAAMAMCLDLGLGKRSRKQASVNDMEDLEKRRTWMGCYYLAGSVATVLRLPQLVKFSPYLEECLDSVSKNHAALPSDKFACSLVRLMHIMEDVGLLFHMDDPGSSIQLNDSRTQYHMKMFERQLEDWKKATQDLIPKAILDQYVSVTNLYIHETAIHNEHNVDDFRPIAHDDVYNPSQLTTAKDFLTNAHLEALAVCVDSMEDAMSAFESVEMEVLRGLPCLHMVWVSYVVVAMVRLHSSLKAPDSKYGYIFLPKMKVEAHLDVCIQRLTGIASEKAHSPAEPFLLVFHRLRAWQIVRNGTEAEKEDLKHSDPVILAGSWNATTNKGQQKSIDGRLSSLASTSSEEQSSSSSMQQRQNSQQAYRGPLRLSPNDAGLTNNYSQISPIGSYKQYNHPPQSQQQSQNLQQSQRQYGHNMILDANGQIDASNFDLGNWDFNVNELNNFDTYMNDVGWMGYLM